MRRDTTQRRGERAQCDKARRAQAAVEFAQRWVAGRTGQDFESALADKHVFSPETRRLILWWRSPEQKRLRTLRARAETRKRLRKAKEQLAKQLRELRPTRRINRDRLVLMIGEQAVAFRLVGIGSRAMSAMLRRNVSRLTLVLDERALMRAVSTLTELTAETLDIPLKLTTLTNH